MRQSRAWLAALETTAKATRDPLNILPRAVDAWAERSGDKPALVSARESFSYAELAARKRRYAGWARMRGLQCGEAAALIMRNRPDYFALWLGLTEIGLVVALISPDLTAAGLAHALDVAGAKLAIVDDTLTEVARDAAARVGRAIDILAYGEVGACAARLAPASLTSAVTLDDEALRIFTSGTTGLPKAANISHRRLMTWSVWLAGLAGLTSEDRHYNALPMWHSVGGVVAVGAPLVNGGSVVIADRFSARGFFDDVARFDCTSFQYIGELCRYLVAAPPSEARGRGRLRLALGNGLAGDVWRALIERFPGLRVLEFYASTEGNVGLYNVEGRIGALGRLPPFLALRDSLALARFDEEAEAPWRGPDGFCARVADGEAGEALGRISNDPSQRFEGYSERAETEKKILRDVFKPGDAWMRSGDLMRRDADGFYWFVDRIGDTFRWKGENVSTAEVASLCQAQPGVVSALVMGVAVAGAEGRAGMAVLETSGEFDLAAFARAMTALPRYARPLFLRLTSTIARTETLKPKRAVYAAAGFDPARTSEPLFVAQGEAYAPLDAERWAAIAEGRVRL